MKFQIDTEEKTIKIEESEVLVSDLFEKLEKMFPNGEWKDYKIKAEVITTWSNPIVIEKCNKPFPWYDPYNPVVYQANTDTEIKTTFCVEC